jgi:hypothetical protein
MRSGTQATQARGYHARRGKLAVIIRPARTARGHLQLSFGVTAFLILIVIDWQAEQLLTEDDVVNHRNCPG